MKMYSAKRLIKILWLFICCHCVSINLLCSIELDLKTSKCQVSLLIFNTYKKIDNTVFPCFWQDLCNSFIYSCVVNVCVCSSICLCILGNILKYEFEVHSLVIVSYTVLTLCNIDHILFIWQTDTRKEYWNADYSDYKK